MINNQLGGLPSLCLNMVDGLFSFRQRHSEMIFIINRTFD